MRRLLALCIALFVSAPALAEPVVLISIDGLRPGDILQAEPRGLKIPNLRGLVRSGAYATSVRGVLPTLTYPSHVTLITGVAPGKHGVVNNLSFDPLNKNQQGWDWYASDIKVPTLWSAAHAAGFKTANVHWPVSVDAAGLDLNLPQIWRTGHADDRKLMRALATPGLLDRLERELGPYAQGIDETLAGDENRTRFAEKLLKDEKPAFMTVYFAALDHIEHLNGPDTPEAKATLEHIDALVGRIVAAARAGQAKTTVAIVSDHGFEATATAINLYGAFIQAGLIDINAKGEVTGWRAEPWFAGGSAAVMLADPKDPTAKAKVEGLLAALKSNPATGIGEIISQPEIAARGGAPEAAYWIDFKAGFMMGVDPRAPLAAPSTYKGMHGYFPGAPEMRSTFIIEGPQLPKSGNLGEIDMRDIAPTLASRLGVTLDQAEGRPLF